MKEQTENQLTFITYQLLNLIHLNIDIEEKNVKEKIDPLNMNEENQKTNETVSTIVVIQ